MGRKRRQWYFEDARTSRAGTMECRHCRRQIESGMYCYYETADAYITFHRHCSSDNPGWAALDKRSSEILAQNSAELAAACAYRDKWGTTSLDQDIADLTLTLSNTKD